MFSVQSVIGGFLENHRKKMVSPDRMPVYAIEKAVLLDFIGRLLTKPVPGIAEQLAYQITRLGCDRGFNWKLEVILNAAVNTTDY